MDLQRRWQPRHLRGDSKQYDNGDMGDWEKEPYK